MKYLVIALLFLFLAACSHRITSSIKIIEKDSTHIDTVKTQKIVKTKGDSIGMVFKFPCPKPESNIIIVPDPTRKDSIIFHKTQKQGRLTESVTIFNSGKVVISCKEDSLKEIIEQQRITIQKFKEKTTTTTNAVQVKFIPKFYRFTFWCFWILVAIVAGGIIYRFRKLLPAPFNLIP